MYVCLLKSFNCAMVLITELLILIEIEFCLEYKKKTFTNKKEIIKKEV